MKKPILVGLAVFFCLASLAQATPIQPCPAASLNTYLNLAGGSCMIGVYVLSGFTSNVANASLILITPIIDKIPGITVDDRRNTTNIEVFSFTFGVGQGSTLGGEKTSSSASGSGGASMNDFSFIKAVNKATPKLLQTCATGAQLALPNPICGGTPSTASTIFPFQATSVDVTLTLALIPDDSGAIGTGTHNISFVPVPEPGAIFLVITGAIALLRRASVGGTTHRSSTDA